MAIIELPVPVEEMPEYQKRLARLRSQSPLRSDHGLVGWRQDGRFTLFPRSHAAGYENSLRPLSQRVSLNWDFLGLIGVLTDGRVVYLPSFNSGQQLGDQLRNELRFQILGDMARKNEEEKRELRERVDSLERLIAQWRKPLDSGGG